MSINPEVHRINDLLMHRYGRSLDGKPNFRIIWSDDLTENRYGTVQKITKAGIYLGEETGLHELPKYSYIKERYILEKLMWSDNPELYEKFSYEPIWVFQDKDSNFLFPIWKAVEKLVHTLLYAEKTKETFTEEDEQREIEKDQKICRDIVDDECSFLHMQMKHGEAIIVPSNIDVKGE
jgi:hypothetical protein